MEGRASRMWEWYTGILIWKTQNPWTSLRGQMYDWFLDVNASLYGTRKGCEPLHPQYNLDSRKVEVVNSTPGSRSLGLTARLYSADGSVVWEQAESVAVSPNSVKRLFSVPQPEVIEGVYFLKLIIYENGREITDNIYWLTTRPKDYTGLDSLPRVTPNVSATVGADSAGGYTAKVRLGITEGISFFNRIKVFDKATGERVLPVHYSDNYVTLMSGDEREISLHIPVSIPEERLEIAVDSWTADRIKIKTP
jgi:hypothetical protein